MYARTPTVSIRKLEVLFLEPHPPPPRSGPLRASLAGTLLDCPSSSAPPPSHQRVARWACAFASHLALGRRVAVSSLTRVLPPTAHAAYRLAPSRACAWASRTVPPLAMPASPVPSAAATTGERAASAAVTCRRSEGVSEGVGRTRSWPLALVSGPVAWRRNRQVPAHSPACRRIVG